MPNFLDDTPPGELLAARDCLVAAGEVWPSPQPLEDKYAGVVGIFAGSDTFPGAALLALKAAVKSTAPMVRYAGPVDPRLIALALPEVVSAPRPEKAGRVQAWVAGPGIDEESPEALNILDWLVRQPEPLLLDASALQLAAKNTQLLRGIINRRTTGRATVLTPHAGEFAALARALGNEEQAEAAAVDQDFDRRRTACAWLARETKSVVLLKGRHTIVSDGDVAWGVDAGHSWSATPGSGDVLAGIAGAVIAAAEEAPLLHCILGAVAVHAVAALRAAETPEGVAPISASDIVESIHTVVAVALRHAHEDADGD